MKQNRLLREMVSHLGKAGVVALFFISVLSCKDDHPTDGTAPSPVTNVQLTPTPGGAAISYDLPDEEDISYVLCEYVIDGVKRDTRASVYVNSLQIEGLPNTDPCGFSLYLVDHDENRSVPYTGDFIPLEPPYISIANTVNIEPAFGGVSISWENVNEVLIGAFLLVRDDYGEWIEYDLAFSSLPTEKKAIRGYGENPVEREFGVVFTDRWNHYSDTVKVARIPVAEVQLDKAKFSNAALPGDNNSNAGGRVIERIWDGNTNSVDAGLWHSNASAGLTPPQTFTIDLGQNALLSRVHLINRFSDDYAFRQHNVRFFKVWGMKELPHDRNDASFWNPNTGIWRDDPDMILLGDFEVIKPSGSPIGTLTAEDIAAETAGHDFEFTAGAGAGEIRYLRFEVTQTWANSAALHIVEVSVFGNPVE